MELINLAAGVASKVELDAQYSYTFNIFDPFTAVAWTADANAPEPTDGWCTPGSEPFVAHVGTGGALWAKNFLSTRLGYTPSADPIPVVLTRALREHPSSLLSADPPVAPVGTVYGRAISVSMQTANALSPTSEYMGYANWNLSNSATLVDSDGNVTPTSLNLTGITDEVNTLAVDTGDEHFDLYQRGARPNNVGAALTEILNVTDIPFARYDVIVGYVQWFNVGANATVPYELNGTPAYLRNHLAGEGYGINDPRRYIEYMQFSDQTSPTFTLEGRNGNSRTDLHALPVVQIIERLDTSPAVPVLYAQDLVVFGDSYSETFSGLAEPSNLVNASSLSRGWGFTPQSLDAQGSGGTHYSTQMDVIEAYNFTNDSVAVWYEGLAETMPTVPEILAYVERFRIAKGDDKWLFVLPIPAPSQMTQAYVDGVNAMAAALIAEYGEEHIVDTRPYLNSLDPDTSIGGMPSSIYGDNFHLTSAISADVCYSVFGDHLRQAFEL